jgi:NAD+ diphosphatase
LFQDIQPYRFQIELKNKIPAERDYVFIPVKDNVLLEENNGALWLPQYSTVNKLYPEAAASLIYLFSVDKTAFYLSLREMPEVAGLRYHPIRIFRDLEPAWLAFAGATASHLAHWYDTHRYCGRCATPLAHKEDERALVCPCCAHIEYPRISPVVIVGIIDSDRILLAKSASGYNRYGLIAGFVEVGETLEDAVRREVMEEVGLRIKNIRYFTSQPWAFSRSVLTGFFTDLDGEQAIRLDTNELAEAAWFSRQSIPAAESTLSLTWTMIEAFRNQEIS